VSLDSEVKAEKSEEKDEKLDLEEINGFIT
jgi:hypothetical protein